jgi:hypothetical protein
MVSRSNLSGRGQPSGVLNRVMNPAKPRAGTPRISAPPDLSTMALPNADMAAPGGTGVPNLAGTQAQARAKIQQGGMVNRLAGANPVAPEAARPNLGTNQALAKAKRQAMARTGGAGGVVQRPAVVRPGAVGLLNRMGQTQEQFAGEVEAPSPRASLRERMDNTQKGMMDRLAAEEAGGTRTESPVVEPTLNRSRRPGTEYR